MPNRLSDETSAYLLQHASNPIDWYPWGEEAWARAVVEDKPVLLSIGYASCHWCHVMAAESFADPAIAQRVNRDFIAIKVDREERPDLDSFYIEALQALTGSAGWPLTAFLTPQRKLFFGGTYFPPTPRDDLPSFASVLESVADEWRASRRQLERQADDVLRQMRERDKSLPERSPLNAELLDQAIQRIVSSADAVHGGFGEAPKFPQPWLVELMLRAAQRGPGGAHGVADLTLRRMARGGIYDQVGGGFHRYTVDASWKVPHFEKMLADNALLARLYTHAWQARKDPLFARIAIDTLEFAVRDLRDASGAFFSGVDSEVDSGGGAEGGFYLWRYEDVARIAPQAVTFFGVTQEGNAGNLGVGLNVLTAVNDEERRDLRSALATAREERPRPPRDEKILTGWNGLAVAALAEAGTALGRPDFVSAAQAVAGFLLDNVMSEDSTLYRSFQAGAARGTGFAEDYAYLAEGLLALWEATFEPRWIDACERVARRMLELFWDEAEGGLFTTPADGEELLLRRKDLIDASTPSPNGVAALVLLRLGVLLGAEDLTRRGVEILELAQPVMQAMPEESGTLLAALDFHLSGPREIALVGDPLTVPAQALLHEVWTRFLPNRVLAASPPSGTSFESPLLEGRTEVGGQPTVYVCEHHTCKRPTSDPSELARQLRVAGPPSSEVVSRAADLARFTLHRMSLFDRLDNPLWIDPLKQRGFFSSPPPPIDHYIPGAMGAPPWPDSKYLARMAGIDPFAVHRIAMQIPDTDNSLVHEDLADAALALPPDLAADLAGRAKGWLTSSPYHVMLPRKLGSLVSSLATKGQADAALELARVLLELLPDATPDSRGAAAEEGFGQPPQARGRFGSWDYEEILKEMVPDLVRAAQVPALDLLSDLLTAALEFSGGGGAGPDGSYLWRPAIEEDTRNLDRTLRNALVAAVRDASELIVRENPGMLPDVFERLSDRGWPIFRRIALHLLRQFPSDASGLAAQQLAARSLLVDPHFSREYLLLARQEWPKLDAELREQILSWIASGPDFNAWDAVPDRWGADPSDRVGVEDFAQDWSSSRAALVSDPSAPQDASFAFLPDEPPLDITTPKQAEWVRNAELAEIARFCATWRAPGTIGAPTATGLQRKLIEVITIEPARFASGALELRELPDDYLRAVLAGLREAAKQGTAYEWGPTLDLLASAVGRGNDDPAGRALRVSIARLLAAGLNQGESEIPSVHRQAVWDILANLAREPDPVVPERSVAAEALQGVMRYALWVRRHLEGGPRGRELARAGWDAMPEVREALEAGLDASREPSAAIRAVYGQWFPWLVMLDPAWAAARREVVFPSEASLDHLRQAAWDTYLAMTPVFDQVFELLAADYARTAESLVGDEGLTRPQQGFAEHLIALYLRGRVPLGGRESLLAGFFDRAPEFLRAHALAYVGQMLQGQQDRIPQEIIRRLQLLWEQRLAAARAAADPSAFVEELAQFGTWFASGRFDAAWAVPQLLEVLALTGRVVNTNKVVERLKTDMDRMPYEVVSCITMLVAKQRGEISILGWGQDAQQILSRIVGGSDPRARDVALDLLDTFDLQPVTELIRWN